MSLATSSARVVSITKEREGNHILHRKKKSIQKKKKKSLCVNKESTVYKELPKLLSTSESEKRGKCHIKSFIFVQPSHGLSCIGATTELTPFLFVRSFSIVALIPFISTCVFPYLEINLFLLCGHRGSLLAITYLGFRLFQFACHFPPTT